MNLTHVHECCVLMDRQNEKRDPAIKTMWVPSLWVPNKGTDYFENVNTHTQAVVAMIQDDLAASNMKSLIKKGKNV